MSSSSSSCVAECFVQHVCFPGTTTNCCASNDSVSTFSLFELRVASPSVVVVWGGLIIASLCLAFPVVSASSTSHGGGTEFFTTHDDGFLSLCTRRRRRTTTTDEKPAQTFALLSTRYALWWRRRRWHGYALSLWIRVHALKLDGYHVYGVHTHV